jgi:hypothetical protein
MCAPHQQSGACIAYKWFSVAAWAQPFSGATWLARRLAKRSLAAARAFAPRIGVILPDILMRSATDFTCALPHPRQDARQGRRRPVVRLACALGAAALAGCGGGVAPAIQASCPAPAAGEGRITVLSRGWHTELAIPASELRGRLALFRSVFPGARTVMFGYGKRTFMTARADRIGEYLLGPFPGPAVIEAIGLSTGPLAAYGPGDSVTLPVSPRGERALSDFIWLDLAKGQDGRPLLLGPGWFPGALFYASVSGYSLAHTCNRWTAAALHAAGLPVDSTGVVLSGQVMARAEAAARQCPTDQAPRD